MPDSIALLASNSYFSFAFLRLIEPTTLLRKLAVQATWTQKKNLNIKAFENVRDSTNASLFSNFAFHFSYFFAPILFRGKR